MSEIDFGALGINVDSGVKMPITFPGMIDPITDKVTGEQAYLLMQSEDSEDGKKFQRRMSRDAQRRMRKGGQKAFDDDDPIEFQVDKVTALTVGWNLIGPDGVALNVPFSKDTARKFFSRSDVGWLRREALLFASDAANFTKSLSTSSSSTPGQSSS